MPLIQTSDLPSYSRLMEEGQPILEKKRAATQHIRKLHIGILNLMPDAALEATERQFLRLLGNSTQIAQLHAHFFTLPSIKREEEAVRHISKYYESFETLKEEGLDALILTGANVSEPDLTREEYWPELGKVLDWAEKNVASALCTCMSAHAAMKHFYGHDRQRLHEKKWGLFPHVKKDRTHPLMLWVNTAFQVPHSRFNTIAAEGFAKAGCHILVESEEGDVHLATSPDRFRLIFVQGHLEYDTHSLLKEYIREVKRYIRGENESYPLLPTNYFTPQSAAILEEYRLKVKAALEKEELPPEFPEALLNERLFNTWRDSAKSFMNNWIGLVYQTTNYERTRQYMEGINPDNPLGLSTE